MPEMGHNGVHVNEFCGSEHLPQIQGVTMRETQQGSTSR
jgi:hypothetical protein